MLVVDDEASICRALSIALTRAGCTVVTATSGEIAGQQLRTVQFDVLLADLRIPDMRGDVLFHLAAALQPALKSATVFMTGDITTRADEIIAACGCPMLRKPFELSDVLETVFALAAVEPPRSATA